MKTLNRVGQNTHQGDVFIEKISEAEANKLLAHFKGGKKVEIDFEGRLVVQHGEALGSYHELELPEKAEITLLSLDNSVKKMLIKVQADQNLVHSHHGAIGTTSSEGGFYFMTTQREQRNGLNSRVID